MSVNSHITLKCMIFEAIKINATAGLNHVVMLILKCQRVSAFYMIVHIADALHRYVWEAMVLYLYPVLAVASNGANERIKL